MVDDMGNKVEGIGHKGGMEVGGANNVYDQRRRACVSCFNQ
jgi:hypothetical protein